MPCDADDHDRRYDQAALFVLPAPLPRLPLIKKDTEKRPCRARVGPELSQSFAEKIRESAIEKKAKIIRAHGSLRERYWIIFDDRERALARREDINQYN
ncbi:MAG TPA: hypothetical protein VF399_06085 [bacterium]